MKLKDYKMVNTYIFTEHFGNKTNTLNDDLCNLVHTVYRAKILQRQKQEKKAKAFLIVRNAVMWLKCK